MAIECAIIDLLSLDSILFTLGILLPRSLDFDLQWLDNPLKIPYYKH